MTSHSTPTFPATYPEEYKIGEVIFFGRKFFVTPDVLIPRLDTEALVRAVRKSLQGKPLSHIYDIGTGSGIIGTSLFDCSEEMHFIDISPEALNIAKKNFFTHYPSISPESGQVYFQESNFLENIDISQDTSVILVANLPYIRDNDWIHMSEDTIHEPALALFGGEDTGFELYERLFRQIHDRGIHGTLFIEFGFDQRIVAEEVLKKYTHWKYRFFSDFATIERFAEIIF